MVKQVIREKQWGGEVEIIESDCNKGLAASILGGVEKNLNKYGKVIVIEDDLITSIHFLEFMNNSLNKYEKDKRVIQISGFSLPVKEIKTKESSYFLNITSS